MRPLSKISLDLLKPFHFTAKEGSMTKAARALFVTQPAVSHAVSLLEETLGCRLFERSGKRLSLTPEGEALYEATESVFHALDIGDRRLAEVSEAATGTVALCAPYLVLGRYLVPRLAAFHAAHPGVQFRFEIENRMKPMLETVAAGTVDVLFLAAPESARFPEDLDVRPLCGYRYALIGSRRTHPELAGQRIGMAQAAAMGIIILRRGNNTRSEFERVWSAAGLRLSPAYETPTMAVTEDLVSAGFGIGADLVIDGERFGETHPGLFEIGTDFPLPRGHVCAVVRRGAELSPAARALLDAAAA
jgi:DNA-binding transcriptional LysR family regulator